MVLLELLIYTILKMSPKPCSDCYSPIRVKGFRKPRPRTPIELRAKAAEKIGVGSWGRMAGLGLRIQDLGFRVSGFRV